LALASLSILRRSARTRLRNSLKSGPGVTYEYRSFAESTIETPPSKQNIHRHNAARDSRYCFGMRAQSVDLDSIRQGMRTMYSYSCFDLECLCRELSQDGVPKAEIRQRLDDRAADLLSEAAATVREETVTDEMGEPEVAEIDAFLARTTSLCCMLLAPLIEQWIETS